LYSMFALTSDKNNFLDDCEIFKNMINTYWDFNSIDLIRNFSIDLYDNGYTEISEKYLEYYYNTVDTLNYEIDLRLGNINYENKRYDKSIKYYKSALNSSGCDTEYLNFKIYELEKMVIE